MFKKTIEIIGNAPLIILVYNDCSFYKKAASLGEDYLQLAHLSEIESISAAIQNMFLLASAVGLGMAWLNIPLLANNQINKFIQTKNELIAILTIGYPGEKGNLLPRKNISQTVKLFKK